VRRRTEQLEEDDGQGENKEERRHGEWNTRDSRETVEEQDDSKCLTARGQHGHWKRANDHYASVMLNLQNEGDFNATLSIATTAVPKV
jgi:L-cysteine desulfidase